MERLTNRDKEIPLPNADNVLFWARVHEKLARYEDAEEQAYFASKPKTYCEKYPTGCMFCDLLLCGGEKETAEERCNPCKPTQPECGECEYAKPTTNYDRLRAKSVEELAEFLADVVNDAVDNGLRVKGILDTRHTTALWIDWLKMKCEEAKDFESWRL